jgi:uncharacterized transporter YbjL
VARFLGYDIGAAAGLLSGSRTVSPGLGVATDAINQLDVSADQKLVLLNRLPVAFAVTYIFGTAGSAWLLASLGPRLLGVDLPAECKKLAEVLDVVITNKDVVSKTIRELADSEIGRVHSRGVYLRGLVRGGQEMPFAPGTVVDHGDVLQMVGSKRNVERAAEFFGYADRATNATDMIFVVLLMR